MSDRVCLHDASVCLSMGAFGGVGPAPCLCVSDHVCLIVCVFMMPLCISAWARLVGLGAHRVSVCLIFMIFPKQENKFTHGLMEVLS